MDRGYLITNASWVVGQGLTGVLDCVVRPWCPFVGLFSSVTSFVALGYCANCVLPVFLTGSDHSERFC